MAVTHCPAPSSLERPLPRPTQCACLGLPSLATVAELASSSPPSALPHLPALGRRSRAPECRGWRANRRREPAEGKERMATSGVEKSNKKKTEKKLAAREEAKLLAGFMGVMNNMRKQVRAVRGRWAGARRRLVAGPGSLADGLLRHGASEARSTETPAAGGGPSGRLCNRSHPVPQAWSLP